MKNIQPTEHTRDACYTPVTSVREKLSAILDMVEVEALTEREVEQLPEAAFIIDPDRTIRAVNGEAIALLQAPSEQHLIGYPLSRILPPGEGETTVEQLWRDESSELELRRLDSSTLQVAAVCQLVTLNGESSLLMLCRSLTMSDSNETPASNSADLVESIFRLSPSGLLVVRLRDGKIIRGNRQFAQITGHTCDEVLGGHIQDLCSQDAEFMNVARRLALGQTIQRYEMEVQHMSGAIRKVVVSAEPVTVEGERCALLVGLDVTEQKRVEVSARENRDMIDKMFHASPAPSAVTRESDGLIMEVNESMCNLVGADREEVIGRTTVDVGIWEDTEQRMSFLRRIRREGPLYDFEHEITTISGEKRTMLFTLQRIHANGTNSLLSVGTDITGRKEAEQALKSAKEHAEEMARFRSGILTNVTHEVRTPLTVILGFTTMLRQGVRDEYRRFVDLIERSGKRLLLTLDSVLDLAQLEAGTLDVTCKSYNIADLVSGSVEALKPRARENGTQLTYDLGPEPAYVTVDFQLFERVLDHLIDNAIKFTENGHITVRLETTPSQVMLHIADTGIGIHEEFLPHVFEAFKQESTGLERDYQGSGLGLTVSKRLIEHFNGRLDVTSTKGEGSTFTITLPRCRDESNRLTS